MFLSLQLGLRNRLEQTFPCLACQRYEGLIAATLKMDLQRQGQLESILSELNRRHNNLDAMRYPRNYSPSLQGPIDASSQAAIRAFMYLSDGFEEVKWIFVMISLSKRISPELVLKLFRVAEIFHQRDIPMAPEFMTHLQIFTESLESHLELLELFVDYFMWIKWRRYKARWKRDWLLAPYICLLSVLFPSASSLSITILAFCIIYIIRSF